MNGIQLSGFVNVNDDVNGVQIAGLFNRAKKVNGVQIGLINRAYEVNGVSIGLLNIIKKGYKRLEASYQENDLGTELQNMKSLVL